MKALLKEIRVEEAVGFVLAHDLTRIVPGESKGPVFRRGHVIREEDIPRLLDIGKRHVYIMELEEGELHENDAAKRLGSALLTEHLQAEDPHEGKVVLRSTIRGLFHVKEKALEQINALGDLVLVTKINGSVVQEGGTVAVVRTIPLVVAEEKVARAEKIIKQFHPLLTVKPFVAMRVGVVTTGSEVLQGRIEDRFGPRVREKLAWYGAEVVGQRIVGDEKEEIQKAIRAFLAEGVDMVICTGGMSVDPDDRTPGAIRGVASEVVAYGLPVLPGSMLMLAYVGKTPVFGLPGCVMYDEKTSFDLLLPRVLAGETISREEIGRLGHGGLL